jgi:hypothetical protein
MYILPELREYPTHLPTEADSLCDWAEFYFLAYLAVRYNHGLGRPELIPLGIQAESPQTSTQLFGLQKESLSLCTVSDLDTKGQKVTFGSPSLLTALSVFPDLHQLILVPSPVTKQVAVQRLFRSGILRSSYLDDKAGTTRYTQAMADEIDTARRSVVGKRSHNYLKVFRFLWAEMVGTAAR